MYSKLRPWCEWFTINEPAPPIAHHGTLDIRVYFSIACYLLNVCVFGWIGVQWIRLCGERMHLLTSERERERKKRKNKITQEVSVSVHDKYKLHIQKINNNNNTQRTPWRLDTTPSITAQQPPVKQQTSSYEAKEFRKVKDKRIWLFSRPVICILDNSRVFTVHTWIADTTTDFKLNGFFFIISTTNEHLLFSSFWLWCTGGLHVKLFVDNMSH